MPGLRRQRSGYADALREMSDAAFELIKICRSFWSYPAFETVTAAGTAPTRWGEIARHGSAISACARLQSTRHRLGRRKDTRSSGRPDGNEVCTL